MGHYPVFAHSSPAGNREVGQYGLFTAIRFIINSAQEFYLEFDEHFG